MYQATLAVEFNGVGDEVLQVLELLNNLHRLFLYEKNQLKLTLAPAEIEPLVLEVLKETVQPIIEKRDIMLSLGLEKPYLALPIDRQKLKKTLRVFCLYYSQRLAPGCHLSLTTHYLKGKLILKLDSLKNENVELPASQASAGDLLALDYCKLAFQALQTDLELLSNNAVLLFNTPEPV